MTDLWLVPADTESFDRTLANPIDLRDAPNKPPDFPDECRVWGVRTDPAQGTWERNRANLERMETGDPLLIYRKGTGTYRAAGHVGPFWHTTYVRDNYWNGGPALDVFAVTEFEPLDIPAEGINRLLGYKHGFRPQGLWRVADDRPTDRVLTKIWK